MSSLNFQELRQRDASTASSRFEILCVHRAPDWNACTCTMTTSGLSESIRQLTMRFVASNARARVRALAPRPGVVLSSTFPKGGVFRRLRRAAAAAEASTTVPFRPLDHNAVRR
jgi:hypothetical protein